MNISLAYVASLNGKITKGDNPDVHAWSSGEDWKHFMKLRDESDVVVLDRKTYEVVRPSAEPERLRIVFTSTPERFRTVPGQLEFTDESPTELVKRLMKNGHQKVLLAGGARLSSDFLAAGLVDDIYISFEPILFGRGRPMIREDIPYISVRLQATEKLNKRGTLLAHYKVERS